MLTGAPDISPSLHSRTALRMNYECLKSKGIFFFFFLYLQFKRPQIFCRAKLFMYSNESDFEDIFSFLLLFHEFRVHPSEGFGQNCLRLLAVKVLAERGFKKRFLATSRAPCSNIILYISVVAQFLFPTCGRACLVQCRYRFSISSHCYSGQVLACQAVLRVCACVCVRASPLCPSMFSLLLGLRSVQLILPGKNLPWEEKDGVGARVSAVSFHFNPNPNPNPIFSSFIFLELKRFLAACQRLGMQWYSSRQQGRRQVKPSCDHVLIFCFCDPRSQRGTFKLVQITREMWSISGSAAAIHWNTDKFATNILTLSNLLAWSFNGTNLANPPNIHAYTRLNPKFTSLLPISPPTSLSCSAESGVLTRTALGWHGVRTGWDIREWHGIGGHAFRD